MNHPLSPSIQASLLIDYPPRSPDIQPHSNSQSAVTLLPPSPPDSSPSNQQLRSSPPIISLPTKQNKQPHDDQELFDHFSAQCKKMFYHGDPNATRSVEQIIKQLPAASKAAFTKQMASIRSQFHRDAANSRRAEVDKLLLDTMPSSLIIKSVGNDTSLSAMRSPRARQERNDRLIKFINAHCVRNMVGVHPFFSSLCAVLHLLLLPARKGGSGKRRIEWDIDLALFCEAGGEPFLRDSIEFLKGVLGFEDHLKPLAAPSFISSTFDHTQEGDEDDDVPLDIVIGHPDGDDGLTLEERQELEVDIEEEESSSARELTTSEISRRVVPTTATVEEEGPFADSSSTSLEEEDHQPTTNQKGKAVDSSSRGRTISDPFLDPRPTRISPRITVSPAIEDQYPSRSSNSSTPKPSKPLPASSSSSPQQQHHKRSPTQNSLDAPQPTEIRTFRSPSHLTNPELRELIDTFPSFISIRCRSLRFNSCGILDTSSSNSNGKKEKKVNGSSGGSSGTGGQMERHGVIRVSVFERDENWKGTFVERIKLFFFRMFGI